MIQTIKWSLINLVSHSHSLLSCKDHCYSKEIFYITPKKSNTNIIWYPFSSFLFFDWFPPAINYYIINTRYRVHILISVYFCKHHISLLLNSLPHQCTTSAHDLQTVNRHLNSLSVSKDHFGATFSKLKKQKNHFHVFPIRGNGKTRPQSMETMGTKFEFMKYTEHNKKRERNLL